MLKLDLVLLRKRLLVIMELVGGLGLKLLLGSLRLVGLGSRLGVLVARGLSVQRTSYYSQLSLVGDERKIGTKEG
jgi:hypothetical protein